MSKRSIPPAVIFTIVVLLTITTVAGCAASPAKQAAEDRGPTESEAEQAAPGNDTGESTGAPAGATDMSVVLASELQERRIIRNAELDIEVKDLDQALEAVQQILAESNGYVSQSSRTRRDDREQQARLNLRVPSDKFEAVLLEFRELGVVTDERTWTDDVTEEFIDLTAEITNLEAQEERLRQLVQRAEKVEDILQVERELTRIRQEIDSRQGRLRFLRDQVAYSTIILALQESNLASPTITATGISGIWQRSRVTFVRTTNFMLELTSNLVVVIAGAVPVVIWLAFFVGIIWLLYRQTRRHLGRSGPPDDLSG